MPCGIPAGEQAVIYANDFRSLVQVHLSSILRLFKHRLRMDRIEKVIYVDTLQPQPAVQNMFAPCGEM